MKSTSSGNGAVQGPDLFSHQTIGTLQKRSRPISMVIGRREWPIDLIEEDIILCQLGLLQFHLPHDPNITFEKPFSSLYVSPAGRLRFSTLTVEYSKGPQLGLLLFLLFYNFQTGQPCSSHFVYRLHLCCYVNQFF